MSIKIEERPGEQLVYAVVGGTFEEFEIRVVEGGPDGNFAWATYDYYVNAHKVPLDVYLTALETSRASRLALDEDDDGGPVEPVEGAVH